MRRIVLFAVVAISFIACEKDPITTIDFTENTAAVVENYRVSLDEALQIADSHIDNLSPQTRGVNREVKSTELYVAKPATRSVGNQEVSFYLVNYEDNQGFAMVSTDERATPVYAYSDSGQLTSDDLETNPALKIFMEGSIENYQIEVAGYDQPLPIDSIYGDMGKLRIVEYDGGLYYESLTVETTEVEPLLTTEWHQYAPYGSYCPNGIGGCGPIAAAQVMAYYKHPSSFNGYPFDWEALTASPEVSLDSEYADNVALLVRQIADNMEASYNPEGTTSVDFERVKYTLRDFDYTCGHPASFNRDRIIDQNLELNRPVIIKGYNLAGVGHAWVIDGYRYYVYRRTYYYTFEPYDRYDTFISSSSTYFHCNIGWDDTDVNGYYLSNSFLHPVDIEVIHDIVPVE
ncbi:MAG: C10 family peptidase [Alistipes sp.]|nr:C10 family peptidase [Alistipes sp.]